MILLSALRAHRFDWVWRETRRRLSIGRCKGRTVDERAGDLDQF
ncbi:hypothetical protein [Parasedimentitalea marina]|nr:hypothetical protein [Parasedimentitalea marina]